MTIKTKCPTCSTVFNVADEKTVGKIVACKKCGQTFRILPLPEPKAPAMEAPVSARTVPPGHRGQGLWSELRPVVIWSSAICGPVLVAFFAYILWPTWDKWAVSAARQAARIEQQNPERALKLYRQIVDTFDATSAHSAEAAKAVDVARKTIPKLEPVVAKVKRLAAETLREQERERAAKAVEELVDWAEDSVALIHSGLGTGTGFVVGKGMLVTNAHVMRAAFADEVKVYFPSVGEQASGVTRVIYEDEGRDLCLVELDTPQPALPIARTQSFRRGEEIIVIGNPGLGKDLILKNAVTRGLLSTESTIDGHEFYQLSVSINPGNSGGPVLNRDGQVIAVATLKASQQEGIAFGIPAEALYRAMQDAQKQSDGERSKADREHLARTLFRRLSGLGYIYTRNMSTFVQMMDTAIDAGGSAARGIEAAREVIAVWKDLRDSWAEGVEQHLRKAQQGQELSEDVKKNLLALWATVQQAQSYVDHPRGSFQSYSAKARELQDEFERLVNILKIQLNLVLEEPKQE
ncbi:MAG: trypsin-like peptidase domain-containing protein [Planctomycetes bacterium]|nr:trypsin-like peptidase domain-containing protein [Planctomycetota bacterium]